MLSKLCSFHERTLLQKGYVKDSNRQSDRKNEPTFKVLVDRAKFSRSQYSSLKDQIKKQSYEHVDIVDISRGRHKWFNVRKLKECTSRFLSKFRLLSQISTFLHGGS